MNIMKRFNVYKVFSLAFCMCMSVAMWAGEEGKTNTQLKFYGFVRNEFYYNSRQNEQSIDGVFNVAPKPIDRDMETGKDRNAIPEAELISVCTRLGVDAVGPQMLGAATTAKVEADFAGTGTTYFLLRLRQAYAKFSWKCSDLLIGQTWHPLYGSVSPTVVSLNTGAPFQPFNRSPQVRYTYKGIKSVSLMVAAAYQMQYSSQGPDPANPSSTITSPVFMKRALLPDVYVGAEAGAEHWAAGVGFDTKTIKPTEVMHTSYSALAYVRWQTGNLQLKAKALWGQNMSDYTMFNGYAVSRFDEQDVPVDYTNFNMLSSWVNVVYGKKWRVGLFAGFAQNFGTGEDLALSSGGKYTAYGRGFYASSQTYADCLWRAALFGSFNLPKLSFNLEYNYTTVQYGTLQGNGRTSGNYWADNQRVAASVFYHF